MLFYIYAWVHKTKIFHFKSTSNLYCHVNIDRHGSSKEQEQNSYLNVHSWYHFSTGPNGYPLVNFVLKKHVPSMHMAASWFIYWRILFVFKQARIIFNFQFRCELSKIFFEDYIRIQLFLSLLHTTTCKFMQRPHGVFLLFSLEPPVKKKEYPRLLRYSKSYEALSYY